MPATLRALIDKIKGDIATKLTERNEKAARLAELRGQDAPDETEVATVRAAQTALDAEIDALNARRQELEAEQARDEAMDKLATEVVPAARRPSYDGVARVGREKRQYNPDSDKTGRRFLNDVARQFRFNDPGSAERLGRHMDEERVERAKYLEQQERAVGTGAFAGLTVPQYLTDLYAPATAALRPFADVGCTHHDLPPEGMTVNISRITTASAVALQASENAAVQETDMDDTLLTANVQTAAGQQTVSLQAIERGTGIEDVTVQDLMNRYATTLDSTLLNQAVTGLSAVATATAYTDATPTVPELYPKILGSNAGVEAALLAMGYPTHVTMHSRRWNWLMSQMSSTWPLMAQPGIPVQAIGQNNGSAYGDGVRGVLPNGLQVIVDNNIGTTLGAGTEDELYVTPKSECHLWEDPAAPMYIRAEQTKAASLGVLLVVYGWFAYTFGRYANGMGKVNGTGLIAPTF
jgi:hypothetical protein